MSTGLVNELYRSINYFEILFHLYIGYWAKCVPENCFDLTNKLTYFYVDENGELFLNSPGGEISLLTGKTIVVDYILIDVNPIFVSCRLGISVRDPLWGLLDIYGNCISIELVEDPQPRPQSLNGQMRSSNSTATMNYYQDLRSDLRPLTFLPVHNHSISFFSSSSTNQADKSIVLFDTKKSSDGLIYFTEPLSIRTGLLIEILRVLPSNESRSRSTTNATVSTSKSTHLQFGLTNCDIKTLYQQQNSVPLTINAINQREELWVIQDFPLANKTLDTNDEFLFVFAEEGIIYFSQNNSQFQDFLHLDPSLTYYPFLIFKGDVVAVRSAGFLRSLNKCRGLPRSTRNNETTASSVATASNDKTKSENSSKKSSQSKSNADCSICLDRERDTVLIPCGHICLCYACATHVQRFGERQCKSFFFLNHSSYFLSFFRCFLL